MYTGYHRDGSFHEITSIRKSDQVLHIGEILGYIGIMENKMETTVVYWGYMRDYS